MMGSTIFMLLVEKLEVLGFVGRAEDVGVGRVGLLGATSCSAKPAFCMNADISARPPSSSMKAASSQGL